MTKKLLALALVAGAAYLFKTKHGKELRGRIGEEAGKLAQKAKDAYGSRAQSAAQALEG